MKRNAVPLGVDPERVVVGGESSGGNITLLAAYAPQHLELTPKDVKEMDLSVRGVVSYYGPTDLRVYYRHAGVINPDDEADLELVTKLFKFRPPTHTEMVTNMTGGLPDQVPEMYDLLSPTNHVGPHCPPTLLLQGEHDSMTSAAAVSTMYRKLVESGVPVIYVEFPQVEHGFDVALHMFRLGALSQSAPPTQAALYDVERFLALMV